MRQVFPLKPLTIAIRLGPSFFGHLKYFVVSLHGLKQSASAPGPGTTCGPAARAVVEMLHNSDKAPNIVRAWSRRTVFFIQISSELFWGVRLRAEQLTYLFLGGTASGRGRSPVKQVQSSEKVFLSIPYDRIGRWCRLARRTWRPDVADHGAMIDCRN